MINNENNKNIEIYIYNVNEENQLCLNKVDIDSLKKVPGVWMLAGTKKDSSEESKEFICLQVAAFYLNDRHVLA